MVCYHSRLVLGKMTTVDSSGSTHGKNRWVNDLKSFKEFVAKLASEDNATETTTSAAVPSAVSAVPTRRGRGVQSETILQNEVEGECVNIALQLLRSK